MRDAANGLREVTAMELTVIVFMLVLFALVGLAVKMYDLKRKRDGEAVAAQARVSDALLMDPTLGTLPLTPTARVPLWKGSPLIVDIRGAVPRSELRDAALALARREVARDRSDFLIEDHIAVKRAA
jgi:hypothetical protein